MYKRLMVVILIGVFVFLFTNSVSSAPFEKIKPTQLPKDQVWVSSGFTSSDASFCMILNDDDDPKWFVAGFDSGYGVAVYMDPEKCPGEAPYPFKITDVHFSLYGAFSESPVWPVEIRVRIRELYEFHECNGPGDLLYSELFLIPADSGLSSLGRTMNLSLNQPVCISQPFFLELEYETAADPDHPLPSFLFDLEVASQDSCNNWGLEYGTYYRWSDFWVGDPPGEAIIRATGYANVLDCWYWKQSRKNAPSGMPDFDQNQDDWESYCGPTAVANCLWWFDAVPEGWTPPQLIDTLAKRMYCNPEWGTYVDTMQMALDQYFQDYGFALQESTFYQPKFSEMEDSLKKCQDIILLLGFWEEVETDSFIRRGGHYVTMAGVCSESLKIAFSDPYFDNAESDGPGRVRPPHAPHADNDTLHNDPAYVSQDIYTSTSTSPSPGNPDWGLSGYPPGKSSIQNFVGKNFHPDQLRYYQPDLEVKGPIYTEVEWAVMICPKTTGVEEEEESAITPKDFELYQSYPNPFNNQTIIKYNLRKSCQVSLTIYNILGQKVKTLVEEHQKAGPKSVNWDGKNEKGRDVSSGIYFYQLKAAEVTKTKRMVLLK
jgi:hypothetical protein